MRVLEIITVPFFEPRGTAFSSLERTRALSRMGHSVDVLAYPLGADVDIPGVRIHRIPPIPPVRSIPMGPSLAKLVFDLQLAVKTAWWLRRRGPWDLVHVHEEAAFWVAALRPFHRGPVLYDMHSSLVEQLSNFGHGDNAVLRRIVAFLERLALRRADAVIVVCPELEARVRATAPAVPVQLIENLQVEWELPRPNEAEVSALRTRYGLVGRPVILYSGTFGLNQGLELAVDAMRLVAAQRPEARLLLVGGVAEEIDRVRRHAADRGVPASLIFAGRHPSTAMPSFMALADVLLSPRTRGTNTPLKIYSYLASGKPIVATDLRAHTQVLTGDTAEIVPARPDALAAGIFRILADPDRARAVGRAGQRLAETKFGPGRYHAQLAAILDRVCPPAVGQR